MADRLLVNKQVFSNNTGGTILSGASGDSQTVISILICETAGADETFTLDHCVANGSSPITIYKDQSLPAKSTFEHTSKIVVDDTDILKITFGSNATVSVVCSYLQQDDA